jgi:hypothetical protein
MNPISYDSIAPNIAQVSVDGAQVQVSWKCPATGRAVGTSVGTMAADASLASRVGASVTRSIASEVIYGAARLVSGLLGGAAGRVVSNATYTAAADLNAKATAGVDYTEASRQAAIVAAFESVKSSFVWDEARRQFVAR